MTVQKQLIYHCLVGVNGLDPVFKLINEKNESKPSKAEVLVFFTIRLVLFLRFLIQPKPAPPRRDVHLQHVIINEKTDQKISEHRVCFF